MSLSKLVVENHAATVLYHTAYNPYFHTNLKVFRATDFIAELLQHLPEPRLRLIRRYGLYSSRSRGTWLRKPHLLRLAPEGWRQDHAAQEAVRIGLADLQYAETSVSHQTVPRCMGPADRQGLRGRSSGVSALWFTDAHPGADH